MNKQEKKKMENSNGLHNKYIIAKADGSEIDPKAKYMVLRYDKAQADIENKHAALDALYMYAWRIKKIMPEFAKDIIEEIRVNR